MVVAAESGTSIVMPRVTKAKRMAYFVDISLERISVRPNTIVLNPARADIHIHID